MSSAHESASTGGRERPGLILVDDDPLIAESLSFVLRPQFEVHVAPNRAQAKALLQALPEAPALALVDLGLPPTPHLPDEGFTLIRELLAFNRTMKILVLSGQSKPANIRHALTLGAVDFVPKPCDAELLRARLQHQVMILAAETAPAPPRAVADDVLLGASGGMRQLRELVRQFASSPFPVLIEGESGSGKELVAECLHRESARRHEPLLTLNCAAFTPELLGSQLFGHARGAYTGADKSRAGFFEEAGRGTLVLDEVGELPAELQTKFLRVLENGEFYRVGETTPRRAEARIVAATNRELRDAVRRGSFRADLFHRLSVLTISVPPLREREHDWRILLDHFLSQYAGTVAPFTLDAEAEAALAAYPFPGNVRELRNIVIRLGTKYPGCSVGLTALKAELEPPLEAAPTSEARADEAGLAQRLRAEGFRLDDELAEIERRYVTAALTLAGGNLSKAARLLGVNRTTLYSKLARLGLGTNQD
ncbi:MAG: sigma-54-dependent Fis family transcriptional regulator [Gammaproteobacteria bacterium]|nr:sigma-54-dependent Fis family transcriptional regulator [Gammaproteobacteria bacterium]MBI5617557.1 sigma-54-dependent Fis family transcriptional regulator [Gammaproteobacteria bacterium]